MPDERLILASTSPRRRELLATLGVGFDVQACPLSEPARKPAGVGTRAWAEALAYFKARAAADQHPGYWALGADTVVAVSDEVLGKPRDADDARRMLLLQAGRWSEVITGVALVRVAGCVRRVIRHEVTRVWMRHDPKLIEAYVCGGDWQGKAGAYGIQDIGDRLVERIVGSFTNVVGLPLERVTRLLRQVGFRLAPATDKESRFRDTQRAGG